MKLVWNLCDTWVKLGWNLGETWVKLEWSLEETAVKLEGGRSNYLFVWTRDKRSSNIFDLRLSLVTVIHHVTIKRFSVLSWHWFVHNSLRQTILLVCTLKCVLGPPHGALQQQYILEMYIPLVHSSCTFHECTCIWSSSLFLYYIEFFLTPNFPFFIFLINLSRIN